MTKRLLTLALFALFLACNEEVEKEKIIQQEIANAVKVYEQKKLDACRTAALDSANRIVDSIILARNTQVDTLLFVGKPVKPTKPILKSPLDTTPVVPILPKN
jgi:hypothetical protein